jgi:hypothetical protein
MDIEKQIDAALAQQQADQDALARAALRDQFIEQARLASLAEVQAAQAAARAAYLERARAAHGPACTRYKAALREFVDARLQLQALDTILDRQGFGGFSLGVELQHRTAVPDQRDILEGLGPAVEAARKTLGG